MGTFINFIQNLSIVLILILLVMVVFCLMAISATNRRVNRLRRRYDLLLRGQGDLDIEEVLLNQGQEIDRLGSRLGDFKKEIQAKETSTKTQVEELISASRQSLQKVGLYRYNALEHMEGNLSFSLCLLNSMSDGVIITTIYGRNSSTTYAKEVVSGEPLQPLSIEEEMALSKALTSELNG